MDSLTGADLIYALAVPALPGRLYAARAGGLFISDDGGKTWAYAYRSLLGDQPLPTLAVALSPGFERDRTVLAGTPGAVLASYDGGDTWQVGRLGPVDTLVSSIAFSPSFEQDGTAFAVTSEDGVFCSYDFGSSWFSWNFGLLDAGGLSLAVSPAFAQDRTVFAGVSSGLFVSRNAGKSWQGLPLPVGYDGVTALAVSPRYAQDATLWAATESGALLASTDGGASWSAAAGPLPGGPVHAILVSSAYPSSPDIALVTGQALYAAPSPEAHFSVVLELETEITAVCPVPGWQRGGPVFLGLVDQVLQVNI